MTVTVRPWNELVGDRRGDAAGAAVLAHVATVSWLKNVGSPSDRDAQVHRVTTWGEAMRIFDPNPQTRVTGTLGAAKSLLVRRLDMDSALNRQTVIAADRALAVAADRHYGAADSLGEQLGPLLGVDPFDAYASLGDYLHEFIRLLFIEIYAGDVAEPRCTYFRDQFGWFLAGFLPCGWDGEWPDGMMRVF